jgi:hypothetical protein
LTRRNVWMKNSMNITTAAMAPAAMVGVYGQSTYSGIACESSADPGVDILGRRIEVWGRKLSGIVQPN